MKPVSGYEEYDAPKPPSKWPLFVMIGVIVALLAGCCVAFWHLNEKKYEETVALAQAWDFQAADRLSGILMPMYEELPQLQKFIDAGLLMGMGAYEDSKAILTELGSYLNAQELYKENSLRYGQRMFELERYEEALDVMRELGTYGEAQKWADECAYRIGLGYYTKLSDETDPEKILEAGSEAIQWFSSVQEEHEYAPDMLERVSAYMYALGTTSFSEASAKYNVTKKPEDEDAGAQDGAANTDTQADNTAEPGGASAGGEATKEIFQDAVQYFSLIPEYEDSKQYLEIVGVLELPEKEAAMKLREEMWEFAPARKFVLGKYIPYFFYGKWMINEHYYLEYTDVYRFYMLRLEDGTSEDFGSGGISLQTRTGWKTAFPFRVMGKDVLEVQSDRMYTLTRLDENAPQTGEPGQLEQLDQMEQTTT